MARLGLLGGTFNPPHHGHVACAVEALAQLRLDRVALLPVHAPPHKDVADDPGPQVRLDLCRLAVVDHPQLEVCDFEVRRGGRSYTVDTLEALAGADDLTFIVGGDMAWSLPSWRDPEKVVSLARLGVAEREDVRRDEILDHLAGALPAAVDRIDFFDMPRLDISSTDLRRRAAAGRPIAHLAPAAVAAAVAGQELYR